MQTQQSARSENGGSIKLHFIVGKLKMTQIFDFIQIFFWSVTYLLIVAFSFSDKNSPKIRMPLVAGALNFACEVSLLTCGFTAGRFLWMILDVAIIVFNLRYLRCKNARNMWVYMLCVMAAISVLCAIAHIPGGDFLCLSTFVVDFVMAAEYVLRVNHIAPEGKIWIALTKLIGDLFAWLAYLSVSPVIAVIGFLVLLLNGFYLSYCLEELSKQHTKKSKRAMRN